MSDTDKVRRVTDYCRKEIQNIRNFLANHYNSAGIGAAEAFNKGRLTELEEILDIMAMNSEDK